MVCSKSDWWSLPWVNSGDLISQMLFCENDRTQVGVPHERDRGSLKGFTVARSDQGSRGKGKNPRRSRVLRDSVTYFLYHPTCRSNLLPITNRAEVIACEGMPCSDVGLWSGSASLTQKYIVRSITCLVQGSLDFHRLSSAIGVKSIVCALPKILNSRNCQEPSQRYLKRVAKGKNDVELLFRRRRPVRLDSGTH